MGANGSYDKNLGGVPKDKRTHTETGYTVLGHKVLLQTGKEKQTSNILNSNSKDATYLIAKLNEDDTLTILISFKLTMRVVVTESILAPRLSANSPTLGEKNFALLLPVQV